MNKIRMGVIFFLVGHHILLASEVDYFRLPYCYRNQVITIDNLLDLVPVVPQDINKAVQDWLIKNGFLGRILSGIDGYMVSSDFPISPYECGDIGVGMYHAYAQNVLHNYGWDSKSHSGNWIIQVADDWYIKASGLSNRLKAINYWLSMQSGEAVSHAKLVNYIAAFQGTTIFVSRMASYLRIKDIIEREKLSIVLPELYLIHIPGRPLVLRDENYILLEKSVGNDVVYLEESTYALDQQLVMDLVKLVGYTGFSSFSKNCVVTRQGQVYLIDCEMNFIADQKRFFTGDIKYYENAILRGWQSLSDDIITAYAYANKVDIPQSLLDRFKLTQEEVIARLNNQISPASEENNFLQVDSEVAEKEA